MLFCIAHAGFAQLMLFYGVAFFFKMSLSTLAAGICCRIYSFLSLGEFMHLSRTSRRLRDLSTHEGSSQIMYLTSCTRLGANVDRFRPHHLVGAPLATPNDVRRIAKMNSLHLLSMRYVTAVGTCKMMSLDVASLTHLSRLHTLYCNFPPHVICVLPPLSCNFQTLTNLTLTSCNCRSVRDMANAPNLQTLCIETVVHHFVCHDTPKKYLDGPDMYVDIQSQDQCVDTQSRDQSQDVEWNCLIEAVCTCPLLHEFSMDGFTILPTLSTIDL
jgi:hypothetical protein